VTSILGGQFRNQAETLETVERAIERSRSKLHSGKALNVLDQRIAMLRTVSEARQDQDGRVTSPAENV
jgi:hypothetical protein